MIENAHAFFGAAIAALLAAIWNKIIRRIAAGVLGLFSHYLLDFLPHADYPLTQDWQAVFALIDMFMARFLIYVLYKHMLDRYVLWIAVVASVLPDLVQLIDGSFWDPNIKCLGDWPYAFDPIRTSKYLWNHDVACWFKWFHRYIQHRLFRNDPVYMNLPLDLSAVISYAVVYSFSAVVAINSFRPHWKKTISSRIRVFFKLFLIFSKSAKPRRYVWPFSVVVNWQQRRRC